jgi:hypothetical protein
VAVEAVLPRNVLTECLRDEISFFISARNQHVPATSDSAPAPKQYRACDSKRFWDSGVIIQRHPQSRESDERQRETSKHKDRHLPSSRRLFVLICPHRVPHLSKGLCVTPPRAHPTTPREESRFVLMGRHCGPSDQNDAQGATNNTHQPKRNLQRSLYPFRREIPESFMVTRYLLSRARNDASIFTYTG